MSGAYQDSLPKGESVATSLSAQMNHYESDLRSSSQPSTENTFYQDGSQYPPPHGVQHEQLHYPPEDFNGSLAGSILPRSNPIAIQHSSGDGYRDVVDSDSDNDDEDENGDIDVEGDAIKLQRKYGNKVLQTYAPDATILQASTSRRRHSSSVLDAPYLGSLSKSSNQVLSLPPMSLAGDSDFGEPPESLVTSYGSLRDSHERGRFLDGPSSYREPSSGKIRQLDHRLRYQTRQPPELNIGERLQQSLKLKELRLKKEKSNNDDRKETTSSLSAMMNEASKNGNTSGGGGADDPRGNGNPMLGTEHLVPIQDQPVTSPYRERPSMSSNMLSTSMTAFELLKSSNGSTSNPPYSVSFAPSNARPAMNFANSSGFQPLSRSMSDPSPRLQSFSLSDSHGQAMPTIGLAAQMTNLEQSGTPPVALQQQQNQGLYFNGSEQRSQHLDHDPNTDGAFGDMEM